MLPIYECVCPLCGHFDDHIVLFEDHGFMDLECANCDQEFEFVALEQEKE